MLRRIDPELGMARFYSLMIERDLFGTVRLVRHWGRIGAMQERELAQDLPRPRRRPPRRSSAAPRPSGGGLPGLVRGSSAREDGKAGDKVSDRSPEQAR